jgi:hypothetical protein
MVLFLAATALLFALADHWTTYLCLREPVVGWEVTEANPLADWLFQSFGLAAGLWIDTVVTVAILMLLVRTRLFPDAVKIGFLCVLVLTTGFAVGNNLEALYRIGLGVTGSAY